MEFLLVAGIAEVDQKPGDSKRAKNGLLESSGSVCEISFLVFQLSPSSSLAGQGFLLSQRAASAIKFPSPFDSFELDGG